MKAERSRVIPRKLAENLAVIQVICKRSDMGWVELILFGDN